MLRCVISRAGKMCDTKKRWIEGEDKNRRNEKDEYTRTCRYLVPGTSRDTWYRVLERKPSTAHHRSPPHRRATHGTTQRCAARS